MKVRIVESLCIACGLCREVCPERAVHPKMQDIHHMYEVIESECTGCGDCLPVLSRTGGAAAYEAQNPVAWASPKDVRKKCAAIRAREPSAASASLSRSISLSLSYTALTSRI